MRERLKRHPAMRDQNLLEGVGSRLNIEAVTGKLAYLGPQWLFRRLSDGYLQRESARIFNQFSREKRVNGQVGDSFRKWRSWLSQGTSYKEQSLDELFEDLLSQT